jgi:hypothetical protein
MSQPWKLVFPMLNRSVTTFAGPHWYLDDGVRVVTIGDGELGAFQRLTDGSSGNDYYSLLAPTSRCIYVERSTIPEGGWQDFAQKEARKVQTLFNLVAREDPAILLFGIVYSDKQKIIAKEVVDLEGIASVHRFRRSKYRIQSGSKPETISAFYRVISETCEAVPSAHVTLDRFNASLTRASLLDRILDVAVSLESLIEGHQEVSYRVAFLSFVASRVPSERKSAFLRLRDLYNARSRIVHGEGGQKALMKALKPVESSWSDLVRLAKSIVNYYLIYESSRIRGNYQLPKWRDHLLNLILGVDQRIVEAEE